MLILDVFEFFSMLCAGGWCFCWCFMVTEIAATFLIPCITSFLPVSFADSGGMPERPCVLTGTPENIEWVLILFLSFFLLSLLPNAVLCQWCYLVISHTSKCWPRETWGSLEHRTSWSDALNCAPQRLFFHLQFESSAEISLEFPSAGWGCS